METNLLQEGAPTGSPADAVTVTRNMLRERAVALAASNGRSAHEVLKSDWEQAKLELPVYEI